MKNLIILHEYYDKHDLQKQREVYLQPQSVTSFAYAEAKGATILYAGVRQGPYNIVESPEEVAQIIEKALTSDVWGPSPISAVLPDLMQGVGNNAD